MFKKFACLLSCCSLLSCNDFTGIGAYYTEEDGGLPGDDADVALDSAGESMSDSTVDCETSSDSVVSTDVVAEDGSDTDSCVSDSSSACISCCKLSNTTGSHEYENFAQKCACSVACLTDCYYSSGVPIPYCSCPTSGCGSNAKCYACVEKSIAAGGLCATSVLDSCTKSANCNSYLECTKTCI